MLYLFYLLLWLPLMAQADVKPAPLIHSFANAFTQLDPMGNFIASAAGPAHKAASAATKKSRSGNLSAAYNFPDTAGAGRGHVNPPVVAPGASVIKSTKALPSFSGINFVTVQAGDTVGAIALRYDMDIAAYSVYLRSVYGPNADLNRITAGRRLPVPQQVSERTSGGINGLDLPP